MTAAWVTRSDPLRLVERLEDRARERKLRLLACGCCRAVRNRFADRLYWPAVDIAERYADGLATAEELRSVDDESERPTLLFDPATWASPRIAHEDAYIATQAAIDSCLEWDLGAFWVWERQRRREVRTWYACLVADVFDPLLSGPVAFDANWQTSTAVALARQMYDSRDFGAMPILADALQDAGCDSDDILNHCRGPGPHVRGCWVVDLVLGKE